MTKREADGTDDGEVLDSGGEEEEEEEEDAHEEEDAEEEEEEPEEDHDDDDIDEEDPDDGEDIEEEDPEEEGEGEEDDGEEDNVDDMEQRPSKRSKRTYSNDLDADDREDDIEDDDEDNEDCREDEEDEDSPRYNNPLSKWKSQTSSKIKDSAAAAARKNKNADNKNGYYGLLDVYGEHKRAVSSVRFAPSRLMKKDLPTAAICASSSADGYIKLWNIHNAEQATTSHASDNHHHHHHPMEPTLNCGGHTRGINDIAWNPISPFLASASDDKTVRLWDMVTGDALVEYRGHDSFVFCVDQYQHMIVSGSFDETVKLWDIRSGDCVSTLPAHSDPVTSVSFNWDGTVVCTGSHDGLIRLWDVATGECLKTIYAAGNPPVCSAKFCPNSKFILASTLTDATLRLWPVHRTGNNLCAKSYKSENHVNKKYSIVADFLWDGNIVTGSETGKVILYDLQTQSVLQELECHEDVVLAVSGHDKLPLIASGAMMNDRRVHFWAPPSFQV